MLYQPALPAAVVRKDSVFVPELGHGLERLWGYSAADYHVPGRYALEERALASQLERDPAYLAIVAAAHRATPL